MYRYIYQKGLYTVGAGEIGKDWYPDSDHNNSDDAADRAAYLNGSSKPAEQSADCPAVDPGIKRLFDDLDRYAGLAMQSLIREGAGYHAEEVAAAAVKYAWALINEVDRAKIEVLQRRAAAEQYHQAVDYGGEGRSGI